MRPPTRNPKSFVLSLSASVLIGGASAFGQAPAAEELGPDALVSLSPGLDLSHDPAIAAAEGRALAAWSGLGESRQTVYFALWAEGSAWSAPLPADPTPDGTGSQAAVAFAPDGTPAVAWVETQPGGGVRLLLSRGSLGAAEPVEVAASANAIESPALAFFPSGQPVLAWAEGNGATYRVIVGMPYDGTSYENAEWYTMCLTQGNAPYDILPTLIGGEVPLIHWYSLSGEEFRIQSATLDPNGDWLPLYFDDLQGLPTNRLPILYGTGEASASTSGLWSTGAIWVSMDDGGMESVMAFDPRTAENGGGNLTLALPGPAEARQTDPDAASGTLVPAWAWREENGGRSDILLQTGPRRVQVSGVPYVAQPRLAADPAGGLHLVFVSDQIDGGTGDVYWTYVAPQVGQ
ncbi:MAG: hypothetical protein RLY93_09785 [Sumerlaeia bacterium]